MPVRPEMLASAMLSLAASLLLWPGTGLLGAVRLRSLVSVGGAHFPAGERVTRPRSRALLFAGLAATAVLATSPSLVGAAAALVAAGAVGVLVFRAATLQVSATGRSRLLPADRFLGGVLGRQTRTDPMLPIAVDLLAVCLRGGLPTSAALRSVAGVFARGAEAGTEAHPDSPNPVSVVSTVFGRAAAASELGGAATDAWGEWVGDPVYGPLARALIVTGESGSAVAARLERVSRQLRVAAGHAAAARAQRVGVALMAPLGLCFLPAFVCLGVIPVVVGIARQVFG